MSKINLDPYLFFAGECREAMEFYKNIFGGELTLSTYADAPEYDPKMKDQIMHASLSGGEITIMASDSPYPDQIGRGKISISLGGEQKDEPKLRKIFDSLSEGVKVEYPLKVEFWGDTFGMVIDKYGVDWMVNISAPKP